MWLLKAGYGEDVQLNPHRNVLQPIRVLAIQESFDRPDWFSVNLSISFGSGGRGPESKPRGSVRRPPWACGVALSPCIICDRCCNERLMRPVTQAVRLRQAQSDSPRLNQLTPAFNR
jgi:hypothetical protein